MSDEGKLPADDSLFRIELVARSKEFIAAQPFDVEIWIANRSEVDAAYPAGFEMRNSRTASAFVVTDSGEQDWYSVGHGLVAQEIKSAYTHSRPIPISRHGRVHIGGADVSRLMYSRAPFARPDDPGNLRMDALAATGPLQIRWYNGEGIVRPQGHSNSIPLVVSTDAEPQARPSLLHAWLLRHQIAPAFRRHEYLQRATVLAVPALWKVNPSGAPQDPIKMMIFYSKDAKVRLDAVVSAYTHNTQDPNLPVGVGNHDLFEAIGTIGSAQSAVPMPISFCSARFFAGGEMDVENDDGGVLDAFFVYAKFERTPGGVVCTRRDDRMGERMDEFLAQITASVC